MTIRILSLACLVCTLCACNAQQTTAQKTQQFALEDTAWEKLVSAETVARANNEYLIQQR